MQPSLRLCRNGAVAWPGVLGHPSNRKAEERHIMHTIALVSQKGGSGKSTLAIGLAIAAMQDGHKVCLLETDPQGTVSNWRRRRTQSEPIVQTIGAESEIGERLSLLEQSGVTLAIIDTAGGSSAMTAQAIRASDLCLIPARPSPADIEAAAPTLSAVRKVDKPFAFILNQTPARSYRLNDAASALGETAEPFKEGSPNEMSLSEMGVLAQPFIVLRNDQQDALGAGLAVTEYALEGKSAAEIRSLWVWVWKKLMAGSPVYRPPLPHAASEGAVALG
jgi:chromosome partitioning protein